MHLQLSSEISQKVRKNGGGGGGDTGYGIRYVNVEVGYILTTILFKNELATYRMKYKPVMQHPANGPPDQFRNRGKVLKHTISFRLFGEVALIHAFSRAKRYILAFRFPKR